jgi:hypothetical protein
VLLYYSKITVAFLVVLVSLLPASAFATPVTQQGNFKVTVAGTAPGSIQLDIALKITQVPLFFYVAVKKYPIQDYFEK